MAMGYTLEQVITMTTTAPAKIINRAPKIGTLQVGAPGDVAIMELVEGPVSFLDTRNNMRDGKVLLKPVQTVINGVPFGRPYQSPFSAR
jgi:dihydroorotase